ncbi:MAG: hypothetical protein ACREND_17075 [Gemmatimonadaceae bacterium]
MRAARDARDCVRRLARRARGIGTALGTCVLAGATAPAPQPATITSVAVVHSSWMAMTVAVAYARPVSTDTLTLGLEWRRTNGRPLQFTAASASIAPGSDHVVLATSYHGILPPPTPMVLHVEMAAPNGKVLLTRDCQMALVTTDGKDAWAGDVVSRRANDLAWRVRACH